MSTNQTTEVKKDNKLPQTIGKFQYEILIEENEINAQELPTEIKKKFVTLGMQKEAYLKKPSANRLESIKKQDAVIHDLIQTWLEQNLPDEETETPAEKAAREKKDQEAADEKAKAEQEVAAANTKAEAEKAKLEADATAQVALETQFKGIITTKGRIHVSDLQKFLKKSNLGNKEEFAGIQLEKGFSFLSSPFYYPLGAQ